MNILIARIALFALLIFIAPSILISQTMADTLYGKIHNPQAEWFEDVYGNKMPIGSLYLYRFADEIYALDTPICWEPSAKDSKKIKPVKVPKGFITDLASIPQVFWSGLPRDGKYIYPAIVHDYLYWSQDRTREEADKILKLGMEEFNINSIVVNAVFWGVRAGGEWSWNTNKQMKASGEKRILKRMPTDPLVPWKEWKNVPDIYEQNENVDNKPCQK